VKKVAKKHSLKFETVDFREKSAYFAKENAIFKFLLKFTHFWVCVCVSGVCACFMYACVFIGRVNFLVSQLHVICLYKYFLSN